MPSTSARKVDAGREALTVYLPDTRGVTISPWGKGNLKLGPDVYTYSRLPGDGREGTCPGATNWCEEHCYAVRVEESTPVVWDMWRQNSVTGILPAVLPLGAKYVRLHVSGDFDTELYVGRWQTLVRQNPEVLFWTYTRSWQTPHLLPGLERLAAEPNMQLFASMDTDIDELPPATFRRAWLADDHRAKLHGERNDALWIAAGNRPALICPEERGVEPNCQDCGYCMRSLRRGDVVFLVH